MSLGSILPTPVNGTEEEDEIDIETIVEKIKSYIASHASDIPSYGKRSGWYPKKPEDFGDGGSYPEIHCAQFPLGMGKIKKSTSNSVPVRLDESGKICYDSLLKHNGNTEKIIHSTINSIVEKAHEIVHHNQDSDPLLRPNDEKIQSLTEKTREALEKAVEEKVNLAMPVKAAVKPGPAQFIRYTPAQQGENYNSSSDQRIIRMVEVQKDPMEPPRFKINSKIPNAPPSPPAPVLHSPPRKITVKERQEWKIPPCISNWKNPKGFTIPLDKRLASDGRGLQDPHINDKFAKLAEALYIADRKARESVEVRAQLEKKMIQKDREMKEEKLRRLAQQAREERSALKSDVGDYNEDEKERDELRYDRQRDRDRERRLAKAGHKKGALTRDKERDISEQIALCMASGQPTQEALYDQRLFNQSRGMDSGFNAGDDESYSVYSEPWRAGGAGQNLASNLYRPSKNLNADTFGEEMENITKTNRFISETSFSGVSSSTDGSASNIRSGPVQFEKHTPSSAHKEEEEDPFQLDKFLSEAKRGKRSAPSNSSNDNTRDSSSKAAKYRPD